MPDARSLRPGQRALADAVNAAVAQAADPGLPYLRGVVSSVTTGPARVVVDVAGVGSFRCPYLASYTPTAGDAVWLGRVSTGSYLCLGREAP